MADNVCTENTIQLLLDTTVITNTLLVYDNSSLMCHLNILS